jgi:competence ComEA-like helix-hairpin-helix protein
VKKLQVWLRALLKTSRRETNGLLILIPLLILILFSETLYQKIFIAGASPTFHDPDRLDSVLAALTWPIDTPRSETKSPVLFDPNRADAALLLELGLKESAIQNLMRYRKAGGKFFLKGDLLKIYGMDTSWYKQIYSFIDLPESKKTKVEQTKRTSRTHTTTFETFDINKADTTQLEKIFGIGPKLAHRIIKYRDKLGGFTSMNQLREVYGLDSAVIAQLNSNAFVSRDFTPRKILLNTMDEKTLASHPYIGRTLAKNIIAYRYQHGPFQTVDDLRMLKLIKDSTIQKLRPYVILQPGE